MESEKPLPKNENPIEGILEGREKRYLRQMELIQAHQTPLISLSVNAPGPDKTAPIWSKVLSVGLEELERKINENNLEILFKEMGSSPAGFDSFLLVKAKAVQLKGLAMDIENEHPLGRLLDLDVFDHLGAPLSRDTLGGAKRTCVICGNQVSLCRRSAKHSAAEVLIHLTKIAEGYFSNLENRSPKRPQPSAPAEANFFHLEKAAAKTPTSSAPAEANFFHPEKAAAKTVSPWPIAKKPLTIEIMPSMFSNLLNSDNFDLAQELGALAAQSLIYEVSRFPAPGLVSPVSNGAHRDMNYYTFVDSLSALIKYFVLMAAAGFSNRSEQEIFPIIREIGKEAERAMFYKTQGVNTHKGAIFILGLSLAAVAKTLYSQESFSKIPSI
ncbi:MAG: citrate lyase holo-[acyl-carrier protein] synthase, partial [Deltaproteobacteria bacterium]|nr:citrate lyase holo-[acyl-carrier protein] synthase [Deltaproteobacteria bacterium]